MSARRIEENDLPDDELLRRHWDSGSGDAGVAFSVIYFRYRETVRDAMEAAGLSRTAAEERVGAVFIRGLNRESGGAPGGSLRDHLLAVAARVAVDPDWDVF
ncbi:MAG TPA: hypothetical protein VF092_21505 [Longimicrobium sp.]